MSEFPIAIFLMGPTASGKTALALELVDRLPLEIVSVDSALVYRGMDIGTSKPDAQTLKKYPHHLINICDPAEAYSAAQFREDALKCMADITARGKIPFLVGGTMLYFRALSEGLSELPSANQEIRRKLEHLINTHGLLALHQRLRELDPIAADKIHPNDPQRIQRALEVYEISGIPISDWWRKEKSANLPYTVFKLAANTHERAMLHQRIEKRFTEMLNEGLLEEVSKLHSRDDLDLDKPSMRSVGYRQAWQYLDGELDYDAMQKKAVVATRQLAKRQLTWLRSEQNLTWVYTDEKDFLKFTLKKLENIPRL